MKKYTKKVLVALTIILSAFSVNARSAKGDIITNKGYAFVIDDNNANVVLHPGLTAGQWKNVMERFTQMKFSKDLQTVLNGSTVEDGAKSKYILYNTYWYNGQARSFGPDKIERDVLVYNGQPWLVVKCAQLISTDGGMIDNAINGVGCTPPTVETPEQDNKQNQNLTNKQHKMDSLEIIFRNGVPVNAGVADTTPWGWIAGMLFFGIIVALVAILAAQNARKSDKKAIRRFEKQKADSNENAAKNFVTVGNTLRSFNEPAENRRTS